MRYILCFLCSLSCYAAPLNQQKYYSPVKEVKMETRDGAVFSRITLANNIIWTVYGRDLRDILRVGTPLGLFPHSSWDRDKMVILCDTQNIPLYYAFFLPEDLNYCPTIKQIQRICTQENSWFSSAEYNAIYTLSDGSCFILENDDHFLEQGEHVYAFYDPVLGQWILFSLDRGAESKDSKNPYLGFSYFHVKPLDTPL